MAIAERCPHCDYAVPHDAVRCAGCRRVVRDRGVRASDPRRRRRLSPAPRLISLPPPQLAPLDGNGRHYRSLLTHARVARAGLTAGALAAVAVAAIFGARLVVSIDRVSSRSGSAAPVRLADVSRTAAVLGLVVAGAAAIAFVAWSVSAYRNLPSLGVRERRPWTAWTGVHRWWAVWLGVPAVVILADTVIARHVDALATQQVRDLANVLAGIVLAGALAAAHEIVGMITVAQARRAEVVDWQRRPRAGALSAAS
jgi:hypothetical protein